MTLGRAGQPAELAPDYVFLASAESSYVVGETLNVNGGKSTLLMRRFAGYAGRNLQDPAAH